MQIPQVMREFITRGARAIQEWEPDQARSWREAAQAGQEARVTVPETRRGRMDSRRGLGRPPVDREQRPPPAFSEKTANHKPGGQDEGGCAT